MKKIIISLMAVGLGFTAQAANRVWNGGVDANFNTAGNWTGGTIAGQTAVFTNSGSYTALNNDITGLTLAGITFTTNAFAYTIDGNAITLGGNITLNAGATNPQVINLPMTLNAARTATVKDGATLTLGGPIDGAFGFTKGTGPGNGGTLILTGTNTFTGDLTLGTGTNKVSSDENMGAGTNINHVQNAKLTTTATFGTSKTITLSATGANQDINPDAGTTLTLNGAITGGNDGAAMRLGGAGKIILAASNDYGATTTILSDVTLSGAGTIGTNNLTLNTGNLNLGGTAQTVGALSLIGTTSQLTNGDITAASILFNNSSGTALLGANLHGMGAALTKTNNGTATLSGSNTYSGGTLILSGILQADSGGALGYGNVTNNATLVFAPPVNITVTNVISGSGVLVKSGADDVTLWGDNTFSGGVSNTAGSIKIANVNALGSGTVVINGGALSSGANIRDGNGGKGVTNNIVLMKTLAWNTGTQKTQFSGQFSGTNSLNLNGFAAGELTLSGNNSTLSGNINANGANIIYAGHPNALGTGLITFNKDGGLRATVDLSGGSGISNNIVLNSPTNSLTVLLTNNLTLSGVISGPGFMIKAGASTLKLTGANTYSNGTTISNGTLIAGADGALGSGNVTVAGGATLTLTNGVLNDYIDDAAALVLDSGSILNLDFTGADTVASVSIGGTNLAAGTYTAANLVAAGLAGAAGTGSLTVGGAASYTLTGSVTGGNGNVTPSSTNAPSGGNAVFTVTANSYYRIASLTTNGTLVGASFDNNSTSTNFTWSNVLSTGALVAAFTAQVATDPAGTPYWWLAQYGLTNFNTDAVGDQDSDGLKAWQEYIANTDPTNKTSCLTVTQSPRNTVIWTARSNRVYSVHWSTNLVQGFTNLDNNATSPYTNLTPNAKVNHYQVRVRLP